MGTNLWLKHKICNLWTSTVGTIEIIHQCVHKFFKSWLICRSYVIYYTVTSTVFSGKILYILQEHFSLLCGLRWRWAHHSFKVSENRPRCSAKCLCHGNPSTVKVYSKCSGACSFQKQCQGYCREDSGLTYPYFSVKWCVCSRSHEKVTDWRSGQGV